MATLDARGPLPNEAAGRGGRSGPHAVLANVHRLVTRECIRLMDGFYSNIEDGLFELAYRTDDDAQRGRCFDLMRELRFRRTSLVKGFARAVDRTKLFWTQPFNAHAFVGGSSPEIEDKLAGLVQDMSRKSANHFQGVLETIRARTSQATSVSFERLSDLPISPHAISWAFVSSCRSLKLDQAAIEVIQQLFARFVLDQLGPAYGECNMALKDAGFRTQWEMEQLATGA